MGFGPDQVDRWAPYQIMAVYRGYIKANTTPKPRAPTSSQFHEAIAGMVH